jgi:hypothetical protein
MKNRKNQLHFFLIIIIITLILTNCQFIKGQYFINISNSDDNIGLGYNLISPRKDRPPFLIDMEGNIIHNYTIRGYPAKMLPNGTIMGSRIINNKFGYLGGGGTLFKYVSFQNWDGDITWEFCNWSNNWARQHHDFDRVENPVYYSPIHQTNIEGNTLILSRSKNIINHSISWRSFQDGVIYEVNWEGSLTGFEWYASEHFNEIGFDKISKFGIFLFPAIQGWLHLNTCSELGDNIWYDMGYEEFNPKNIITCSRHANFLAIINRSTGKIVWKVGPNYYKLPEKKLGKIIGPHHAHLIPEGLPGAGNILVFDNGGFGGYGIFGGIFGFPFRNIRFYSRIIEFNPVTYDIVWEYYSKAYNKSNFLSIFMGSVQRLPNGNTLITEGTSGLIFEVNADKEVVWKYCYEGIGDLIRDNFVYRAYRVPPEWIPDNPADYETWESLYEV